MNEIIKENEKIGLMKPGSVFNCRSFFGYKLDVVKSGIQKYLRRRELEKMIWNVVEMDLFSRLEDKSAIGIRSNLMNRLIVMLDEELCFCDWVSFLKCIRLLEEWDKNGRKDQKNLIGICKILVKSEMLRLASDVNGYYREGVKGKFEKGTVDISKYVKRGDSEEIVKLFSKFVELFEEGNEDFFYYSQEIYNSRKNTVIIYSKNDYYEPICQVKQTVQKKKRKIINTFFNNENLNKNTPEVMSLLYEIINDKLKIYCNSEPSINTDKFFVKNKSSYEIINMLIGLNLNYNVKNQIVNTNNQVIALIIEKDDENIYLPVLPSSINKEYGFSSFKSKDIYFDYDVNVKLLNDIYILTNKKIPCNPKMKIESEGMIVGLITLTNQFVPVVPVDINSISDKLKVIKNESYLDVDINTMSSTTIDSERYLIVKKIKLETNFYNMFRNIFKILINKKHNKEKKGDIIDIINNVKINYFEKIEQISEKMRDILKDDIEFIDYKVSNLNEIEKLIKCFGLSEDKCSKTINCSFSDKNNCVLLKIGRAHV